MLDLTKKILPDSITVDNKTYKIKTDFRLWLAFGQLIKKEALTTDFDFLYEWNGLTPLCPKDRQKGIEELLKFYNPPQTLPRDLGDEGSARASDFFQDSDLIYSAFLECYNINLLKTDLHWHEFLSLFHGLHNTRLNEVMGYRTYNENDKTSFETTMKQLREAWRLEEELTEEEQKVLDAFNSNFN